MPISKYFGGSGTKVMANMKDEYGEKKGKEVFYATANKRGQNPEDSPVKAAMKRVSKRKKKS